MLGHNAVRTDPRDPMGYLALGLTLQNGGFPPAEAAVPLREAVRLDPSYAGAHANLAFVYNFMNRPDEALPEIELALRLSPHDPRRFIWLPALTISHYLAGRYRDALASAQETLLLNPSFPVPLRHLLATLGQLRSGQGGRRCPAAGSPARWRTCRYRCLFAPDVPGAGAGPHPGRPEKGRAYLKRRARRRTAPIAIKPIPITSKAPAPALRRRHRAGCSIRT